MTTSLPAIRAERASAFAIRATGEQLRAGRALLRLPQQVLAARANVSVETIKRLEATIGEVSAHADTLAAVVRVLEEAGLVFISGDGAGPGVRLRAPRARRAPARAAR